MSPFIYSTLASSGLGVKGTIESCCAGEIKRSHLELVFEECKTIKLPGDLPVVNLV